MSNMSYCRFRNTASDLSDCKSGEFFKPAIPLSLIDVVNRAAAARGSERYARLASDADYNGHRVEVSFNDYRGYWIARYFYGGDVVLARGSFKACLDAALRYYARGRRGSTIWVRGVRSDEDRALVEAAGLLPGSHEDARKSACSDPLVEEVNMAFQYDRHFGIGAVGLLCNSTSVADYKAKVEAAFAARRSGGRS